MEMTLILNSKDEYSFIDVYDEVDLQECVKGYGSDILWSYESKEALNIIDAKDDCMYDITYFGANGIHRAVNHISGKDAKQYYGNKHGAVVFPKSKCLYRIYV